MCDVTHQASRPPPSRADRESQGICCTTRPPGAVASGSGLGNLPGRGVPADVSPPGWGTRGRGGRSPRPAAGKRRPERIPPARPREAASGQWGRGGDSRLLLPATARSGRRPLVRNVVPTACRGHGARGPEPRARNGMNESRDSIWPETKTCFRGFLLCLRGPEESRGFPKAPAGGGQSGARGAGAGPPSKAGRRHMAGKLGSG